MNINILKDSKTDSKQPKVYDLGTITSTLQALLNVSSITITDEQTIILKITNLDSNINYYLLPLKDYKGSTIYGLGKDIQASDLISIGGSTSVVPNLTQVLTQGDISTYTVPIPNNTFVTFDLGRELTENYFTTDDVGTGGVFLDKDVVFPDNATIRFQAGYVEDNVTPTNVTLLPYRFTTDAYVFYQGARVTDILQPEDVCTLKYAGYNSTDSIQIWFLSIVNRGVKLFTCGITQIGSSAPIISNARGAQGATFTRTRLSAGDYRITASKAIWTGALPCYFSDQSATVYTIVDVGINFIQYWFYYLEDASNLRVISLVSLESSGLLDDVLQYGEQITIKYIN